MLDNPETAGFREASRRIAARAQAQEILLASVAESLAGAGIPYLVLKGLPLDRLLWSRHPARWHKDIDLLVAPADREAALAVLQGLGIRLVALARDGSVQDILAPGGAEGLGTVELHVDVTPTYHSTRFPVEEWFREPTRVGFSWGEVPVPPLRSIVPYLAWHAFSRGVPVLRDILTFAAAWNSLCPADRRHASSSASRSSAGRFLGEARHLAHECWPDLVAVPPPGEDRHHRGPLLRRLSRASLLLTDRPSSWQEDLLVHWLLLPRGSRLRDFGPFLRRAVLGRSSVGRQLGLARSATLVKAVLALSLTVLSAIARPRDNRA